MQSLLRFLLFVAIAAAAVAALYLWRSAAPQTHATFGVVPPEQSSPARPDPAAPAQKNAPALALPALRAIDREFTSLVNRVVPSVVSISAIPATAMDPRASILRRFLKIGPGEQESPQLGSGAIISEDGYIVTNWHVVSNAGAVEIYLHDDRVFPARLVGADPATDIAVLKIDADGLTPLTFGDSDAVSVGQMVFAVGNPLGLSETVTQGIISAKGRRTSAELANEFLQTDTPINPGNSGGPLIDLSGQLVGLNNSILLQSEGIGFAIPSNTVQRVFDSIRTHGRVINPWLGVQVTALTPPLAQQLGITQKNGALVLSPVENSPAARAGLRPGDVIVSYNGRIVKDDKDLINRIRESKPGSEASLEVTREGSKKLLKVTIERQEGE
jgi:serine protease Do